MPEAAKGPAAGSQQPQTAAALGLVLLPLVYFHVDLSVQLCNEIMSLGNWEFALCLAVSSTGDAWPTTDASREHQPVAGISEPPLQLMLEKKKIEINGLRCKPAVCL